MVLLNRDGKSGLLTVGGLNDTDDSSATGHFRPIARRPIARGSVRRQRDHEFESGIHLQGLLHLQEHPGRGDIRGLTLPPLAVTDGSVSHRQT